MKELSSIVMALIYVSLSIASLSANAGTEIGNELFNDDIKLPLSLSNKFCERVYSGEEYITHLEKNDTPIRQLFVYLKTHSEIFYSYISIKNDNDIRFCETRHDINTLLGDFNTKMSRVALWSKTDNLIIIDQKRFYEPNVTPKMRTLIVLKELLHRSQWELSRLEKTEVVSTVFQSFKLNELEVGIDFALVNLFKRLNFYDPDISFLRCARLQTSLESCERNIDLFFEVVYKNDKKKVLNALESVFHHNFFSSPEVMNLFLSRYVKYNNLDIKGLEKKLVEIRAEGGTIRYFDVDGIAKVLSNYGLLERYEKEIQYYAGIGFNRLISRPMEHRKYSNNSEIGLIINEGMRILHGLGMPIRHYGIVQLIEREYSTLKRLIDNFKNKAGLFDESDLENERVFINTKFLARNLREHLPEKLQNEVFDTLALMYNQCSGIMFDTEFSYEFHTILQDQLPEIFLHLENTVNNSLNNHCSSSRYDR